MKEKLTADLFHPAERHLRICTFLKEHDWAHTLTVFLPADKIGLDLQ